VLVVALVKAVLLTPTRVLMRDTAESVMIGLLLVLELVRDCSVKTDTAFVWAVVANGLPRVLPMVVADGQKSSRRL
jgi:hypothetical protein